MTKNIKNDAGMMTLALRLVIGWTYFSAFYRRTILADKLDPELAGYIGVKFNHFLPNAIGIKPIIQFLVENPELLWWNMVAFTVIEGIVGLFIMLGLFTRLMSVGVFALAMGILLGSGWIGTTCLDEWQIGILGVASGFVLFLTGSGKFSLDNYLIKNKFKITKSKFFNYLASGNLNIKDTIWTKVVLIGSIFIFSLSLFTNQVFHNGLWGNLHNKSVKPKLEITNTSLNQQELSFDIFRTEGVDVYGAWIIEIALLDEQNNTLITFSQEALSNLNDNQIENYYIAKIQSGKHSLIAPLGAKANIKLIDNNFNNLKPGKYTLRITDISGAFWDTSIIK